MSTIDEILATMPENAISDVTDEVIVIDPATRQMNIPSSELVFGVESDSHSERKYFIVPHVVGNDIDLTSCFLRVNYRNGNGEMDAYLVDDVTLVDDKVLFSWKLSSKVTKYYGQVAFVVCACRPGAKGSDAVEWHTTQATGLVLEGIEPDIDGIASEANDAVATLIAMVENQTTIVENEGAAQVKVVQTAAKTAETASVAEIDAKGANTLASIPDDYTTLSEAVGVIERRMAPGIICEAEGSAIAVSDASDNYVKNLRIFGKSTQDGTPTPDAPVEIVSVENPTVTVVGKNLLPDVATNESYSGVTIVVNSDKSITVNGTATGNVFYAPYKFTFKAGQSYVLSGCPKNGSADTYFMYINNLGGVRDYGNGVVVNLNEDFTSDVGFSVRSGTTINNLTFYPMISVGSVVDEYEPRRVSQTLPFTRNLPGIPVTSGGNYTDNDGQQWICDEVDLERGVYVRRVKQLTLDGSEAWKTSSGKYIYMRTDEYAPKSSRGFCSCVPYKYSYEGDGIFAIENTIYLGAELSQRFNMDVTTWTNILTESPATLLYNLATPIETPLTEAEIASFRTLHTNKPNTTILNDAGAHMAVEYVADTKLYIDNKITALISGV